MAVFVILALAILAMAGGAVAVAAVQVVNAARRTRTIVEATRDQLRPLTEELEAELAVTSTEMDALTSRSSASRTALGRTTRGGKSRRNG